MTVESQKEGRLLTEIVTEESIAEIVSKWTMIPISKLMSGDKEKIIASRRNIKKTCHWSRPCPSFN